MDLSKIIGVFKSEWLDKSKEYISKPEKIKELLTKVVKMFDKEELQDVLADLKCLYGYVRDVTTGKYKDYNVSNLALAIAALVYLVSPLDFIPDVLPGGLLDDAAVIAWAIKQLHEELARYRRTLK